MMNHTSPQMAVSQAGQVVPPVHPRCKIFSIRKIREAHTEMLAVGDVVEADMLINPFTALLVNISFLGDRLMYQ